MTPGLQNGPPFPKKATKDAVVAIASLEKPSVPLVVGKCEIDVASLAQVQGAKGHAVRSEHWDGDEIWSWSTVGNSGSAAPEHIDGWEDQPKDASVNLDVQRLTVEDDDDEEEEEEEEEGQGGVALAGGAKRPELQNDYVEGEEAEPFERVQDDRELTTKGKDAWLSWIDIPTNLILRG